MARRGRKPLLASVPVALVVVLVIVLLSGSSQRRAAGPGCNNPADSALNQYCDAVPAVTGLQTPEPGQPALRLRLSPALVSRIEHHAGLAGNPSAALLTLPAPGPSHHLRTGPVRADVGSLSAPMLTVLGILGAVLIGGALAARGRRRANRPDSGDHH
jgi:hypothetical protein